MNEKCFTYGNRVWSDDTLHGKGTKPAPPVVYSDIIEERPATPIGHLIMPDGAWNPVYSESAKPVIKGKLGYV